jgi:predicted acetyltransferase
MPIVLLPVEEHHPDVLQLIQQYQAELTQPQIRNGSAVEQREFRLALATVPKQVYLIFALQRPVGFALVGQQSRLYEDFAGRVILAFYIHPDQRRLGYGRGAAIQLFGRYEGAWEVATYGANIPAVAFWRSVVDSYTGGRYSETWQQNDTWRGSIQLFEAPGAKGETEHGAHNATALGSS